MVAARLSASPTMRLMNRPSERDNPIEMVPETRISARLPPEKSSCAHRTREKAATTTTVPTAAHLVGTMAHSWGKSVKYSSQAWVLGSTAWMPSRADHATTW